MNKRTTKLVQKGFTLVELLIVVIILAILAAIVVPQFASSTSDANVSSIKTNLSTMRSAIELYAAQHNGRYPGQYPVGGGATESTVAEAKTAFINQLTQYTDADGKVATSKTATEKYGPYLKSATLPSNPLVVSAAAAIDVLADVTTTDITSTAADGTTGWKIYTKTGRVIANDDKTVDGVDTETF